MNHFLTILKQDYKPIGEIKKGEIRVWRQNGWNGMFYPIFKFQLNTDGHLIHISDSINPVGLIIYFVFCALFSIPWLFWIVDDFYPIDHWQQIIGWIIFMGIFLLISFKIYKMEKQIQLDQIYEILEMELENKKTVKEWGLKSTVVRIITYSLSILLMVICFAFIIPSGDYWSAFGIFLISGVYLFTDLKILLKKRKNFRQ